MPNSFCVLKSYSKRHSQSSNLTWLNQSSVALLCGGTCKLSLLCTQWCNSDNLLTVVQVQVRAVKLSPCTLTTVRKLSKTYFSSNNVLFWASFSCLQRVMFHGDSCQESTKAMRQVQIPSLQWQSSLLMRIHSCIARVHPDMPLPFAVATQQTEDK